MTTPRPTTRSAIRPLAPRRLLWLLLAVIAAGCGSAGATARLTAARPIPLLRVGTIGSIQSLDPWVTQDTLSFDIFTDIYPKLVQYDLATVKLEPDFASHWRLSQAGRILTLTTRPHARWSDGQPLTARDAAWTIGTMVKDQNGAAAAWSSAIAGIATVRAPSANTLVITYRQPVADALSSLEQIPILPEHVWSRYPAKRLIRVANAPTAGHPIVSGGPFTFVKYVSGQVALFARNRDYFGAPAHIPGFGIEFFSNDDAMVAALEAGEIDAATGNPNLPPTDVRPLRRHGFRIAIRPAVAFNDLIINTNPRLTNHRELLNPMVRKAFEYATDRTTMDRIAFLGYAVPGASIVPPATGMWSNPAIRPLPYDLGAANRLLDRAGYRRGAGGIRVADGHPMAYTLLLSPDNGGEGLRSAEIMATDFAKIGVQIKVQTVDDSTLNNDIYADHYRKFDLAMWGWDAYIDPSYILSVVTCGQYYNNSDSGYCNHAYDHLFARQSVAVSQAERIRLVYAMQRVVYNARPYIVLQYLDVIEGWSRRWRAPQESPGGFLNSLSSSPLTTIRPAAGF
ncbi:MAG TPA: peptide ABC transporter substrate-binding protein [Verrucomicrobiae bacterium]|nr:peptide ABC transporter substrate-binding protein [Verrucomicrobiae bacterium]